MLKTTAERVIVKSNIVAQKFNFGTVGFEKAPEVGGWFVFENEGDDYLPAHPEAFLLNVRLSDAKVVEVFLTAENLIEMLGEIERGRTGPR